MKPIEVRTCVEAWLEACDHLLAQDEHDWRAYSVVLEIADPIALPSGERAVVERLSVFLAERGGMPFSSVVNTVFPAQLYMQHGPRGVYEMYLSDVYPQIRNHPDCSWGTYAHRMLFRKSENGETICPLRDLVEKLRRQLEQSGPNRAVYELGVIDLFLDIPVYDPGNRNDRNRPLGAPCLSHLSFKLTRDRKLMLTAMYRSHFYVQRALGNLFGLAHLQHFVAKETGLEVGPLVCHSSMAILDLSPKKWGKTAVRELISDCHAAQLGAVA